MSEMAGREMTRQELIDAWAKSRAELASREEVLKELMEYVSHETNCIVGTWEAGKPTADGGYRQKYKGKWYQTRPIDETPKCDCGLDDFLVKAKIRQEGV